MERYLKYGYQYINCHYLWMLQEIYFTSTGGIKEALIKWKEVMFNIVMILHCNDVMMFSL